MVTSGSDIYMYMYMYQPAMAADATSNVSTYMYT